MATPKKTAKNIYSILASRKAEIEARSNPFKVLVETYEQAIVPDKYDADRYGRKLAVFIDPKTNEEYRVQLKDQTVDIDDASALEKEYSLSDYKLEQDLIIDGKVVIKAGTDRAIKMFAD
jgi:hypothetical protein